MNIQTECVSRNEENEEPEPTKLILSTNELLNNNNNDLKTTKITPKKIDSITEILENNSYYIQTPQQANLVSTNETSNCNTKVTSGPSTKPNSKTTKKQTRLRLR